MVELINMVRDGEPRPIGSSRLEKRALRRTIGVLAAWHLRYALAPSSVEPLDCVQRVRGTPEPAWCFRCAPVGIRGGLNTVPVRQAGGHVLTIQELPSHSHQQTLSGGVGGEAGYVHTSGQLWGLTNITGGKSTATTGEGKAHSHLIPEHDNRPEFDTVVFIMKE